MMNMNMEDKYFNAQKEKLLQKWFRIKLLVIQFLFQMVIRPQYIVRKIKWSISK
jgi:hypothetical protein